MCTHVIYIYILHIYKYMCTHVIYISIVPDILMEYGYNRNKSLHVVKRIDIKDLASSYVLTGISNRSEFL